MFSVERSCLKFVSQDIDLGDNETLSLKSDSTNWRNPGHRQVDSLAGVAPC
jgi:hypothetical protein